MPAGWYPDPTGRYELRYWDGTSWLARAATRKPVETSAILDADPESESAAWHDPVVEPAATSPQPSWAQRHLIALGALAVVCTAALAWFGLH